MNTRTFWRAFAHPVDDFGNEFDDRDGRAARLFFLAPSWYWRMFNL